ncbi:glycine/D-amino acid oxidase-like deaminating enzyme [Flavobacterium endophyticum]|uniref:Glycine/D-amino acid oxidase-like deaminating enzyme n=2 Tax=Flavobacterium endophyticum TaxID=1540163 RepID=A0A495MJK6_9FLAO|nr:glycine/D-amino acid oxidase-like deaminating enzyme [Flavobacterium endophyticum]
MILTPWFGNEGNKLYNMDNFKTGSITSGKNVSFWIDSTPILSFEKPSQPAATDVLVIGGGIAGLTAAYLLLKAGRKVIVAEDGFIGSGESGRTTAHLSCALDDRYYYLESVFGQDAAALAAESHVSAIDEIERIIAEEKIECAFRRVDGYLFLHPSDRDENLDKEFDATKRAGLDTAMLDEIPAVAGGSNKRSIAFHNQAQFHIMRYLDGLAQAIVRNGGTIFTEARAEKITKEGALVNGLAFSAEHIVVATNSPINDTLTMHMKQHAYRSYVIAGKIKKGALPHALWWDTGDADSRWVSQPYHYARTESYDSEYDLLIAGGEDHKTGQGDDEGISEQERYGRLEAWTREFFPMLEDLSYRWSGQIMEPVDSLGFMGKNPGDENIYIITGDSGNGMTHATLGAIIIRDLIKGTENKWKDLYSPSRITFSTAKDFLREAGNMAAQYADWLAPPDLQNTADLEPGHGSVLSHGMQKIAVYRDHDNSLKAFSAVCPHLGCIVQWNNDEKTFDCPCHGSRFTCDGVVVNGPSQTDLRKIRLSSENK